jgi:two-component system chemotaxis sensor kinase CheA
MVHLVRNALDHGVEVGAERQAAGKPEIATISIGAPDRKVVGGQHFASSFSANRMARAYESAYRGLISAAPAHSAAAPDERRIETKLTDDLPTSG